MENGSAGHTLERSDYLSLALIIVYGVYAYLSIGGVFDEMLVTTDPPDWLILSAWVIPLAAMGAALWSLYRQQSMPGEWGLSINAVVFAVIVGFLLGRVGWNLISFDLPSASLCLKIAPAVLVVLASQMILRARVMNLTRKVLGRSAPSTIVVYVVGALLFALVYTPLEPLGFWVLVVSLLAAGAVRISGSVLPALLIEPFVFLKSDQLDATFTEWRVALLIVMVVVYFPVALLARWLIRRRTS